MFKPHTLHLDLELFARSNFHGAGFPLSSAGTKEAILSTPVFKIQKCLLLKVTSRATCGSICSMRYTRTIPTSTLMRSREVVKVVQNNDNQINGTKRNSHYTSTVYVYPFITAIIMNAPLSVQ